MIFCDDDFDNDFMSPKPYDWSTFDPGAFEQCLRQPGRILAEWEVPFWLRATDHRHAWACHRMYDYQSPEDMVNVHHDIMAGVCAWVSPDGELYPASYAAHDVVAEVIIGEMVHAVEKTHARVSVMATSTEDFFGYVERPTHAQRRAVLEHVNRNLHHFGRLRDI